VPFADYRPRPRLFWRLPGHSPFCIRGLGKDYRRDGILSRLLWQSGPSAIASWSSDRKLQRLRKSPQQLRTLAGRSASEAKRPLVQHARSVCAAARSALTLEGLERQIRRGGYESRSKTFRQYLRRVLRGDESFIEVAPGRWSVRATPSSPVFKPT